MAAAPTLMAQVYNCLMRRLILAAVMVLSSVVFLLSADRGPFREIRLADLRDKIEGGWAGQMIGVSFGAPTEFRYREKINEDDLPTWTLDSVANAIDQDDLYVDMTFAKVLDEKGLDATTEDFGAMFKDAKYHLWHANLAARRALKRGVPAALSGTPRYNAHANDIDFQIESDFIGLMAPGLPQAANDLCYRAGRVMNYGDGIYGGMFVSGMYAAAFFEADPRKVVQAGLASIPAQSPYGRVIADVLAWSQQYPDDWRKVWHLIDEKWNKREPCPEGALRPFNIDAKLNGAFIALGLLYGGGDFWKTMEVATRAGQDSDCNPSNACGVLGVMIGYRRIPERWKQGISKLADQKFNFTDFSFHTIVASTEQRAIALVERNGGRVEGDKLIAKVQSPKPPKLEVWDDYGSPAERVAVSDSRWQWKGRWRLEKQTRVAGQKDAEASIRFQGTGVIVTGTYLPNGGKADVYLDGKLDRTVDVCPDEEQQKTGEDIWHAFGLKSGEHTVRLVVRGEPYRESKGTEIAIEDLVVFR
ncbi:MAG: ADP-ribosylglycohydrolase family protein [Acidobacteria bacterium]|nr:ADP-ribosylglycohydrolase family protein [Acidobacteriota bacterium]